MKLKLRDTGLCFKKTKSKCDQYLRRNKNEIKTKDTGLCFKKTKLKCDQYLSCNVNARFFISHTFVSEIRPKLAKIKQKLSSTMRLNFFYWKIICFFIHVFITISVAIEEKIIQYILKNLQKQVCLF